MMPTSDNSDVNQKSQFTQQYWCKSCMKQSKELLDKTDDIEMDDD